MRALAAPLRQSDLAGEWHGYERVSFYARFGDWFACVCLASVVLLGMGLTVTRRSKAT